MSKVVVVDDASTTNSAPSVETLRTEPVQKMLYRKMQRLGIVLERRPR